MAAKKTNYVQSTAILAATVIVVKIIGAIYKIPLYNILDDRGAADFNIAYQVYSLLLTISTAGVPVAISRLISAANSTGRIKQANRIYSVAMPTFTAVGIVCAAVMMIFCRPIANFMGLPGAAESIFMLGPAVFFCCIIAVLRGYSQGHEDMVPTSISQVVEVVCKFVFGISILLLLCKLGFSSDIQSAGAISGVVIGLGLSIPIIAVYRRRAIKTNAYGLVSLDDSVMSKKATLKELLIISIPMTLSSSLLNIITLIDAKVITYRLSNALMLTQAEVETEYAVFSKAHTLFTLPSSLIVSISISVVPAIAAAIALKKYKETAGIMSSSVKLMNLFALPAGVGMCVLAYPLYTVLFGSGDANGPMVQAIMGISSYFVCFQLVSTALVQASGHERIPIIAMAVGSAVKMVINWVLVGTPGVGILGAPISTLFCYMIISLINMVGLMIKLPVKPKLASAFIKPLICTGIMGACAWSVYGLLSAYGGSLFSGGRLQMALSMGISIVAAIVIYFVLIIVTGTITKEDMALVPKGEKIAKLLHIK